MLHQSEIRKLPVLDIATGKILGFVRHIVFDHKGKRLAGIGLSTWTWSIRKYIHRENIRGIGEHAVTIESADVAKPLREQVDLMLFAKTKIPIIGSQVITARGRLLGTVEDYILDPSSYNLTEILLSSSLLQDIFQGFGRVPAHHIIAIGPDAVVVQDDTLVEGQTRGKEVPSESAPRDPEPEVSSSEPTSTEVSPSSNDLETHSGPSAFIGKQKQPPLVVLPRKLTQKKGDLGRHETRSVANVRYLRRVDEILGVKGYSENRHHTSVTDHPPVLMQIIHWGKLWLDRAIMQRPPNSY